MQFCLHRLLLRRGLLAVVLPSGQLSQAWRRVEWPPRDWLGPCRTFRFKCSGPHAHGVRFPMSGSACGFLRNYLDAHSTLLDSARLGTPRRLCSFSLRPPHCHLLFWKIPSCLFSRPRSSNMFHEHLVLSKAWVMVGIVSSWAHISISGVIWFSCHLEKI